MEHRDLELCGPLARLEEMLPRTETLQDSGLDPVAGGAQLLIFKLW